MFIKRLLSIVLCSLWGYHLGTAQSYDLEKCIELAIRNNPSYKTKASQLERAKLQARASYNSFLPTIQGTVGQSWDFGRSVDKTGVWSDRSSMATALSIGASWQIFSGFARLHELRASRYEVSASQSYLEQAKQELEIQVIQLYYRYLYAESVLRVARQQEGISQEQYQYAEAMYSSDKWSRDRLTDAKARLAQDTQSVVESENNLALARLDLQELMQVDSLVISSPREDVSSPMGDDTLPKALNHQASLRANNYSQLSLQERIKSSRAAYWPSLSLSVGYSNNYYKVLGSNYSHINLPLSEQLQQNGRSYVGLNLSIPIFDAFRTRTQIRLNKLNLSALRVERQALEAQIRKEVHTAWLALKLADRKRIATEATIEASREEEILVSEKWRLGRATSYELNEARTKTFVAQIEALNARYDYLLRSRLLRVYLSILH